MAEEGPLDVRAASINALGQIGGGRARAALSELLLRGDRNMSYLAAAALAVEGEGPSQAILIRAAREGGTAARNAALSALSGQSSPAVDALMIDAAQRNDTAAFDKRIDDEELSKNMVAAASQKAAARYGIALSDKVKMQIDAMMPSLLQQLKPVIHTEVSKQIKDFATKSEPKPFILLVAAVSSLMTITTEGDAAKASASLNDRKFALAMKRGTEGWKVTDFKDDVVVQRIVDDVMKQLPAIGAGLESTNPILKPRKRSSA
jgi:hypothetical protein